MRDIIRRATRERAKNPSIGQVGPSENEKKILNGYLQMVMRLDTNEPSSAFGRLNGFNSASEEVTVLLWSNHELWNKADTIARCVLIAAGNPPHCSILP